MFVCLFLFLSHGQGRLMMCFLIWQKLYCWLFFFFFFFFLFFFGTLSFQLVVVLSIWAMPCPSSGCFVMTKCVCQHKVVKGGKLQKSESSLICVIIAKGPTNALPFSTHTDQTILCCSGLVTLTITANTATLFCDQMMECFMFWLKW